MKEWRRRIKMFVTPRPAGTLTLSKERRGSDVRGLPTDLDSERSPYVDGSDIGPGNTLISGDGGYEDSSCVTSAQVVAAYKGDQNALRLMPTTSQRTDIDGELPDIIVTREAALIVLRRLQKEPSTRMEAFTWASMARLGPDWVGRQDAEIELEPAYHEEILEVLYALDYLDDGPMPESRLEHLIKMLEDAPARGS